MDSGHMSCGHAAISVAGRPKFRKLPFFSNLNPSPNGQNGSGLRNSKCHMDHFSMQFTHLKSDSDSVKVHFSQFFFRIPEFCKNS